MAFRNLNNRISYKNLKIFELLQMTVSLSSSNVTNSLLNPSRTWTQNSGLKTKARFRFGPCPSLKSPIRSLIFQVDKNYGFNMGQVFSLGQPFGIWVRLGSNMDRPLQNRPTWFSFKCWKLIPTNTFHQTHPWWPCTLVCPMDWISTPSV